MCPWKWRDAMGRSTGLEPATLGTTNRCSNQLSYDRHGAVGSGSLVRAGHLGGGAEERKESAGAAQLA